MNINIKFNEEEEELLDYDSLYGLKLLFENASVTVNSIKFDVRDDSLQRLQMLSYINEEIEFRDASNNILSLSGSELKTYIPLIENELGNRYLKINKIYNTLKDSLSAEISLTEYYGISTFYEDLYGVTFTEDIHENLLEILHT